MELVSLRASDNLTVAGDYYPPGTPSAKGLLLLHMMPADRASWRAFAEKAAAAGFHTLAIDLRGHGQSAGGPDGYKNFSDAEHQASRHDVITAVEFLKARGAARIFLGGASIGANLALQYLAEYPEARAAFLLSPGLDYRGIATESLAEKLAKHQALYLAASSEDMRSSGHAAVQMARRLYQLMPGAKEIREFDGAGHGTTIFEREPQFMDDVLQWLNEQN